MEHKDSSKLSPIFTEEDVVELDKPYVDMFDSAADIIEFLKMNEYIPAFDYKIAEKTYQIVIFELYVTTVFPIVLIVACIVGLICAGYVKASPDRAYIISGWMGKTS